MTIIIANDQTVIVNAVQPSPVLVFPTGIQGAKGDPGTGLQPEEAEASETIFIGHPIYLRSDSKAALANATNIGTAKVAGFSVNNANTGFTSQYQLVGVLQLNDWSLVTGNADLIPSQIYYLGITPGSMSLTPPETGFICPLGQALSAKRFLIRVQQLLQL